MPPYDPRANRPTPSVAPVDEPAAVESLLDKVVAADQPAHETIDLRDTAAEGTVPRAASTQPLSSPAAPSSGSNSSGPMLIVVGVATVVGVGWLVARRRRSCSSE